MDKWVFSQSMHEIQCINILDKRKVLLWQLKHEVLQDANIDLIETTEPTLLEGNSLLVSGEVARTTSFETGLPGQEIRLDFASGMIMWLKTWPHALPWPRASTLARSASMILA